MAKILIQNGRIWDGNRFFSGDILTDGPVIAKIAPRISEEKAYVYDAAGKTVSAGLVDCHMHMRGISGGEYAIQAEAACFPFGVTAAADAGGRNGSPETLEAFGVKGVVFSETRIRDNRLDREVTLARFQQYGHRAVGLKMFYDASSPNVRDMTPLLEICSLARELGKKVMVHCNGSPTAMLSIVEALAPGDILSHIYHGGQNNCAADDYAALRLAREKGVVLDAAFAGHVHTDFAVLRAAFAAGFFPDTVSTDITCNSAFKRGGRYGQTLCMSMARTAGMTEAAILKACTTSPAAALGQNWGTLQEGGAADLAVLDYSDEPFRFTDKAGNIFESTQGYRCRLTMADGVIVYRD